MNMRPRPQVVGGRMIISTDFVNTGAITDEQTREWNVAASVFTIATSLVVMTYIFSKLKVIHDIEVREGHEI